MGIIHFDGDALVPVYIPSRLLPTVHRILADHFDALSAEMSVAPVETENTNANGDPPSWWAVPENSRKARRHPLTQATVAFVGLAVATPGEPVTVEEAVKATSFSHQEIRSGLGHMTKVAMKLQGAKRKEDATWPVDRKWNGVRRVWEYSVTPEVATAWSA